MKIRKITTRSLALGLAGLTLIASVQPASAATSLGLYRPQTAGVAFAHPSTIPNPGGSSCPSGTSGYSAARWNCLEVVQDGARHQFWIRTGQSGSSGFGYPHALVDHNVDLDVVGDVVANSAYGISEGNNRFLYGGEYSVAGEPIEFLNIVEQRTAGSGSPDSHELGLVTAYCTSSYDAAEPKTKCPEWVDTTIEARFGG